MNKEASKNILTTLREQSRSGCFHQAEDVHLRGPDSPRRSGHEDSARCGHERSGHGVNVPGLINFILSCMSKRAGEGVLEEMEFLTNAKAEDIEATQLSVVETVEGWKATTKLIFRS